MYTLITELTGTLQNPLPTVRTINLKQTRQNQSQQLPAAYKQLFNRTD